MEGVWAGWGGGWLLGWVLGWGGSECLLQEKKALAALLLCPPPHTVLVPLY